MTRYFNNLIARHFGEAQNKVQPRGRSRFEPTSFVSHDPGFQLPLPEEPAGLSEENSDEVIATSSEVKTKFVSNPKSEVELSVPRVSKNIREHHSGTEEQKTTPLPRPSFFSTINSLSEKGEQDNPSNSSELGKDFPEIIDVKKIVTSREGIQPQNLSSQENTASIVPPAVENIIFHRSMSTQREFVKPIIPDKPQNDFSLRRPSGVYQSVESQEGYLKEASSGPPTIQIKIDRIEVRAIKENEAPPKKKREIPRLKLSLDDYLKKQGK